MGLRFKGRPLNFYQERISAVRQSFCQSWLREWEGRNTERKRGKGVFCPWDSNKGRKVDSHFILVFTLLR